VVFKSAGLGEGDPGEGEGDPGEGEGDPGEGDGDVLSSDRIEINCWMSAVFLGRAKCMTTAIIPPSTAKVINMSAPFFAYFHFGFPSAEVSAEDTGLGSAAGADGTGLGTSAGLGSAAGADGTGLGTSAGLGSATEVKSGLRTSAGIDSVWTFGTGGEDDATIGRLLLLLFLFKVTRGIVCEFGCGSVFFVIFFFLLRIKKNKKKISKVRLNSRLVKFCLLSRHEIFSMECCIIKKTET
jgi:hypothetical protein